MHKIRVVSSSIDTSLSVSLRRLTGMSEFLLLDAFTGDILLRRQANASIIRLTDDGHSLLSFGYRSENRHGEIFSKMAASPLAPQQEAYHAVAAIKARNKNHPVMFPSEWNTWLDADAMLDKEARTIANQFVLDEAGIRGSLDATEVQHTQTCDTINSKFII